MLAPRFALIAVPSTVLLHCEHRGPVFRSDFATSPPHQRRTSKSEIAAAGALFGDSGAPVDLEKCLPWHFSRREAKIAISASPHFQALTRVKMAEHPASRRILLGPLFRKLGLAMMRCLCATLAVIPLGLNGCQDVAGGNSESSSSIEIAAFQSLDWVVDADPIADARLAIAGSDLRLLSMARRGAPLPGVPIESAADARDMCGVRYLPGTTDRVLNKQHLELLRSARDYAERYNSVVVQTCLKKP
jgi:hypothetical protein